MTMSSADSLDPELSQFFDSVVDLAARPCPPDVLLQRLQGLGVHFETVAKYRSDTILNERVVAFARRRFSLVDLDPEYAEVGNEVLLLSMVLVKRPALAASALKAAILGLSHNLAAPGALPIFGKLLKRLQGLARASDDEELQAWVKGAINALPGD